jgi:DUF4097 and DUF4098 domain-containing protein YvlB
MYQQTISVSEAPRVEVTGCHGDLTVTAWDQPDVLIEVDDEQILTVEEREDAVAMAVNGDGSLTVPTGASLTILQAHGNLSIEGVKGGVEVATVHGDAWLKDGAGNLALNTAQGGLALEGWDGAVNVGMVQGDATLKDGAGSLALNTVQGELALEGWDGAVNAGTVQGDAALRQTSGDVNLGTVGGDLAAEDTNGALSVASVGGDAYLRGLDGALSLGSVGGDLAGRDLAADVDVAQVGGDASLKTVFAGPHTYRIQAGGDIAVKALPDSSATFTLQAVGGRIKVKGLAAEAAEGGQWRGVLGDGEAQVTLISHGSIKLRAVDQDDREEEYAPFGAGFGEVGAIAGWGEELGQRIQQHVAEKLGKIDFEAIARREAERARRHAEREMARAQRQWEKAQRKAERAQHKKGGPWPFEWGGGYSAQPPAGRRQPVSEEERMAVLKMLAEGKISAAEAETLLQALEG